LGLLVLGIEGVAVAFFVLYLAYVVAMYGVGQRLTDFCWSPAARRLLLWLLPIVVVAFLAARLLPLWPATVFGGVATMVASVLCLRGLVQRIGPDHRIMRLARRVPGMRLACGL
jgi:PST family polysaccharide transporter